MPFTAAELTAAGYASLDHFERNRPTDQIQVMRPWLSKLRASEKEFPGGKQYITVQLRTTYASNFTWYYGAQTVTYNTRQSLNQANYTWGSAHDGMYLDEDRLFQNGIALTDDNRGGQHSGAERLQLTNLLEEQTEILGEGFDEAMDYALHRDGTQSTEAIPALDALIAVDPTGTVGGIDASPAAAAYWRNHATGSLSSSTIIAGMETGWRACVRNGGRPDYILAGETIIDVYRAALLAAGEYQLASSGIVKFDGGVGMRTQGTETGLAFKGVPIVWDPVFDTLDTIEGNPTPLWKTRMYFLNCRHLRLRPGAGHNRIKRKPPRVYDRYVHYWALTWKGALVTDRRHAHALLSTAALS